MNKQFSQGIDELRSKLIDTTRRNKLINYKRPSKSTNLKIIDESVEFIFNFLINDENKFKFKSVSEPKLDSNQKENKEKIEVLRKIIEESDYQGERQSAQVQLDKLLSQQTSSNILLSPEERAKQLGYDISLELADINLELEDLKDSHLDDSIQTLHYPLEMEKILVSIDRKSKSIIGETGSNMLYLILCVLEWNDGKNINHSPLISVPVVLTKVKRDGKNQFLLEYTSENIDTNYSLAEKLLSDFNIILPEIKDDITFRNYINEVFNVIKNQSSWRIKQEISLDFLHFGKFLMFKDLKEENWNDDNKLIDNEILKNILVGKDVSNELINDVISNNIQDDLPIVMDADSSQYGAIKDVIEGKNVIIEGPPGTGKSQTITNIIATLLHQNKSILFVSEKLAALEVVYKRLDDVGLSDFCLELHSNKTQKTKVLESLNKRIYGFYDSSSLMDDYQIDIEINKDEIKTYNELIHKNYGRINKSIFDIFWETDKYLSASQHLKFDIPDVDKYTQSEVNGIITEFTKYISFYKSYDFNTFYWKKLDVESLSFLDIDDFINILINKREILTSIDNELKTFDINIEDEYSEIKNISNFVKTNNHDINNIDKNILKVLPEHLELFNSYVQDGLLLKDFSEGMFKKSIENIFIFKTINEEIQNTLLSLKEEYEYVNEKVHLHKDLTYTNINNSLKIFELFNKIEDELYKSLNKEFNNDTIFKIIKDFEEQHTEYIKSKDLISSVVNLEKLELLKYEDINRLNENITCFDESMILVCEDEEKKYLIDIEYLLKDLINLNENIFQYLGIEKIYELNFVNDIKRMFTLFGSTEKNEYLKLINTSSNSLIIEDLKNFNDLIPEFEIELSSFIKLKNSLSQDIDLEKLKLVLIEEVIMNEKIILANKDSFFRFFNNSYKQAKKEFESLLKDRASSDKKKWEDILFKIKHYIKAKDKFNNNDTFKLVFKNLFKSEDTDIEKIKALNNWYLLFNKIENKTIRGIVENINERKYDYLISVKNDYLEILNKFNISLVNINKYFSRDMIKNIYSNPQNIELISLLEKVQNINKDFIEINNNKNNLEELLKTKLSCKKKEWEEILFQVKEYIKSKNEINNNDGFKITFGSLYNGEYTDVEKIRELNDWYQLIKIASIGQDKFLELILEGKEEVLLLIRNSQFKILKEISEFNNLIEKLQNTGNSEYLESLYSNKNDINYIDLLNKINEINSKINGIESCCKENLNLDILNLNDYYIENIDIEDLNKAENDLEKFDIRAFDLMGLFTNLFEKLFKLNDTSYEIEKKAFIKLELINLTKDMDRISKNVDMYKYIQSSDMDNQIKLVLINSFEKYQQVENVSSLYGNYIEENTKIKKYTSFDKTFYSEDKYISITDCIKKLDKGEENKNTLSVWTDLNRISKSLKKLGLELILKKVEDENLEKDLVIPIFKFNFYNTLIKNIFRENKLLQNFNRLTHEQLIENFKRLDKNIIMENRYLVSESVGSNDIPYGRRSNIKSELTELNLIENELSKKKRHIPIRQLVQRAPNALKALKPCFMMSPLSVSQYLPNNEIKFDVLVIDEASQLRPEEALGSIARASQIVIVGDPKQLPPTSFFQAIDKNEEEDETVISESESILDICLNIYKPIRQLRWHYRSQHESLIDFSNQQFYDNNLIVFPSPTGAYNEKMGVKYHYVKDSFFHSRKNKVEAKKLVEHLLIQMKNYPKTSIGVGTFNGEQRDLIQDLVDEKEKNHKFVAEYIANWNETSEPFFVKNLENLQGDERDVIMISTTYGRNIETETIHQRFGPINSDVGWRRLNVMFTRSKQKMEIFTSLKSNDIKVTENSSRGVKSFKAFLNYIETGLLKKSYEDNEIVKEDSFTSSIIEILKEYGYEAIPKLGVSGVFIDLAIKSIKNPNDFVLAIEFDGSSNDKSKSLRDSERLKNDVLKNLGWDLYRIWSADWYKNRDNEVSKLIEVIKKVQSQYKGKSLEEIEKSNKLVEKHSEQKNISLEIKLEKVDLEVEKEVKKSEYRNILFDEKMLKEKLIELRDTKIANEFRIDRRSILSDMMIELFVKHKPLSLEEFRNKIPQRYRNENVIDVEQMKYINDIFDILELGDE